MSQSIQFDVVHDQAIVARILPSQKKIAQIYLIEGKSMRVISKKALDEFAKKYPDAKEKK